jgi:hypothetical protein
MNDDPSARLESFSRHSRNTREIKIHAGADM